MPRFRRSSLIASALALVLPSLLLTACGGGTGAGTKSATSSDGAPDLSSVTLAVGDTGWSRYQAVLKLAGLDETPYKVKWSVFQGGDLQLQAMRAGALDVAASSEIPPVFAAADGKANFKVVAVMKANTLQQEVVAPKGSKITGIAQLKGKKVGYVKNTTAQYFLYELLKRAGLRWTDIQAVPLLPDAGLAALTGGSVDALASYGNAITTAHAQGATTIGSGADILSGNFNWEASDKTLADPTYTPEQALGAKILATRHATTAVGTALRLLGNPGLTRDNPLERHVRDIQCAPVHAPQEDTALQVIGAAALSTWASTADPAPTETSDPTEEPA
ncbi:ABC transporter substrate-binding protein [Streptomyces sp. NPDC088124]|uniref:ABC transporter substrate-binding protein n=1 Tax=Streptomyces sp. NPDC088124 TaxID=3154654 RepID=UPI00343C741C